MFGRGSISGSWLVGLATLMVAATGMAEGGLEFRSPAEGELVLGETEICFTVEGDEVEVVEVYVAGRLVGNARGHDWCVTWIAAPGVSGADIVGLARAGGEEVFRVRRATMSVPFGREVRVTAVQLYPVVRDSSGQFVRGLELSDFEVLEGGRAVDVELFAETPANLSMAMLLDTSESMYDRLGLVKEAACGFVDSLDATDRLRVAAFHHALRQVGQPNDGRAQVMEGIRGLEVGGGTALFDALISTIEALTADSGRRAVIVFSDGKDERSLATAEDVIMAAHGAGAMVYAVGSGEDYSSRRARRDLQKLADETGGEAHFVSGVEQLPAVFDSVLTHLRSQYLIGYTPPDGKAGLRQVEVRTKSRGLEVQCRRSYLYQDPDESTWASPQG